MSDKITVWTPWSSGKRLHLVTLIVLLIVAAFFLLHTAATTPLVDYDEATYAQVTRDTLASRDVWTLKRFNEPWFEKPPLYFWSAMVSVSLFGESELAFRFPSILFSLITLTLVYLLAWELTKSRRVAILALLFLLFVPEYLFHSHEVRLDPGLIMTIMASLYSLVVGWRKPKVLFWVLPFISLGTLFKSVAVLSVVPILFFFVLFYHRWAWLKSKYFWLGSLLALIIVIPWHLIQHLRYGAMFWNQYIGYHVIDRALQGVGNSAEKAAINPLGYFAYMWEFCQPLTVIMLGTLIIYGIYLFKKKSKVDSLIGASLASSLFILIIFTFARTQIITYILPIYPFLALAMSRIMVIVCGYKQKLLLVSSAIILSLMLILNNYSRFVILPYQSEEKAAAQLYAKIGQSKPLYVVEWPVHESIRYYSLTKPEFIKFASDHDVSIAADSYFILSKSHLDYFLDDSGVALPEYADLEVKYAKDFLLLLYTKKELVLKSSGYKEL
jgi:4-amino-4-deoxy-L-arabinose transferase-like glycosyltransferase